jgi:hypothetical protein
MEAIRSSETSVLIRATRCHLPEDDNHHSHRRGNLKSYMCTHSLLLISVQRFVVRYIRCYSNGDVFSFHLEEKLLCAENYVCRGCSNWQPNSAIDIVFIIF